MDEGEAGDVGPGRPSVGATNTNTMTTLADQPRDSAGVDPVREPTHDFSSLSDNTVTERHRAVAAPAVVAARNPTLFYQHTALSSRSVDGHQVYCGGSVDDHAPSSNFHRVGSYRFQHH